MFLLGDAVRCVSLNNTKSKCGLNDSMRDFLGKTGSVARVRGDIINLNEVGGSWHPRDFELVGRSKTPEWLTSRLNNMLPTISHDLDYDIFDPENPERMITQAAGSCFESYEYDLEEFSSPKGLYLRWRIQQRSRRSKARLTKQERRRWFQNWKRIGYIHPETSIQHLVDNHELIMPCADDANDVYMAVCVARYTFEQPDVVRFTLELVDLGWKFLTAQALWQVLIGSRGHQLVSRYMLGNGIETSIRTSRNEKTVAFVARTQNNYISAKRAGKTGGRRSSYTFNWWGAHERYTPRRSSKEYKTIIENVNSWDDLKFYNPYTGEYKKKS